MAAKTNAPKQTTIRKKVKYPYGLPGCIPQIRARTGITALATTVAISLFVGVLRVASFTTWSLGIVLGNKDLATPIHDSIANIGFCIIEMDDFVALLFAFGNLVSV